MKLSIAYLAASALAQEQIWDGPKELAVIAAVQDGITGDDLVLEDPKARSNKQWHDCGAKPALAVNGQSVECSGAYCVSVCPQGYRSQGRWRIKCKADNTWAHSKFSPCVTCPPLDTSALDSRINVQTEFRRNLQVLRFFCGDSTDSLDFLGFTYPRGGKHRVAKCLCQHGQNGDPQWKKSCNWFYKKTNPFGQTDVDAIQCTSKQPNNPQIDAEQPTQD